MKSLRQLSTGLLVTGVFALSACQKATDKAMEMGLEKSMEAQMESDGQRDAKVDVSEQGFTIESKDANGQVSSMQMGNATVTEQERHVPLYPGAHHETGSDTLTKAPESTMAMVNMSTKDNPAKVIAFYRDHITQKWPTEMSVTAFSSEEQHTLTATLADGSITVNILTKQHESGDGSSITIMSHTSTRKADTQ